MKYSREELLDESIRVGDILTINDDLHRFYGKDDIPFGVAEEMIDFSGKTVKVKAVKKHIHYKYGVITLINIEEDENEFSWSLPMFDKMSRKKTYKFIKLSEV